MHDRIGTPLHTAPCRSRSPAVALLDPPGRPGDIRPPLVSDTLLNGRDFADAELVAGDRLDIGPIELEVLDAAGSPAWRSPRPQSSTERPALSSGSTRDAALPGLEQACLQREEIDHAREDLERARDDWNRQRVEMEQRLAGERDQLQTRAGDLEAQNRALAEERQLWETERHTAEERFETQGAASKPSEWRLNRSADQWEAIRLRATSNRHSRPRHFRPARPSWKPSEWRLNSASNGKRSAAESDQQSAQQAEALQARQAELEAREWAEQEREQWEAIRPRATSNRHTGRGT